MQPRSLRTQQVLSPVQHSAAKPGTLQLDASLQPARVSAASKQVSKQIYSLMEELETTVVLQENQPRAEMTDLFYQSAQKPLSPSVFPVAGCAKVTITFFFSFLFFSFKAYSPASKMLMPANLEVKRE